MDLGFKGHVVLSNFNVWAILSNKYQIILLVIHQVILIGKQWRWRWWWGGMHFVMASLFKN